MTIPLYFFREGLYFEDNFLKDTDIMHLTGYTDALDLYYEHLAGRVPAAEKPKLQSPDEYRKLISNIEAIGKEGFTKVTTALLDCDSETFEYVLSGLEELRRRFAEDGRDHDLSLLFKDQNRGVTFLITRDLSPSFWAKVASYCELKMYQTKNAEWILVATQLLENGDETFDFRVYNKEWEYDPELEPKVEQRKRQAVARYLEKNRKIGRNEPCPCNSGLKYKKCCGRVV